jgi:mannose-6-phosphate isomerase class I
MDYAQLYPLRFEPIYQYRLWGGRRLSGLLSEPLPGDGPIGEAWVLSDRTDFQSLVANGPLKGQTVGQVMERFRASTVFHCCSSFSMRTRCFRCKSIPATIHLS